MPLYGRTVGLRFCDSMKAEVVNRTIREKTGLIIDAYFSATKIRWILENVKGARELADEGKLAFGTVDSWLVWNLTRGKLHVTDVRMLRGQCSLIFILLNGMKSFLKFSIYPSTCFPR